MTGPDKQILKETPAELALRFQAEARVRDRIKSGVMDPYSMSPAEIRLTLHELHVHQIELEMQNEELLRTQQELETARARYFDLYDLAPAGYCTVGDAGHILQSNLTAATVLGVARGALIGRLFSSLIISTDQDIYYLFRKQLLETGIARYCELHMLRQDGTVFWAHIAATMASGADGKPELRVVLSDVSARRQVEDALVKATALQKAIVNSAYFSSIATDANGVIQIFNVGAERMLGYAAADVINRISPADISEPQELVARAHDLSVELDTVIAPGFEALVFKASRGIEDIYELTYIRKDGSRLPAIVSVTALRDAQDGIIGYLLIGSDNTARKRVDTERAQFSLLIQEQNAELERAIAIADKANHAKSDFLSNMSHELRTPLSAILGFAQLIESGTPEPTASQQRSIEQILQAGWYLLDLINEILDLALIESGKLSLSLEPVPLANVMLECQTMIEPMAEKRGITVSFPQLELPVMVWADHMRLKQVIINLLSNAIKYNRPEGSVVIDCVAVSPDRVRVCVRDTGAGLTEDKLTQLFQPFNRLGQEVENEQGTGIGLVVCKRLVELMDGTIGVESTVGTGSEFWIELQRTAELPLAAAGPALLAETAAVSSAHTSTLLYVEDNPANLLLVEEIMARRPDITLLSARDGLQGVDMARRHLPDVILMDINLPGISGIKAMKILAVDSATAHIPVIALSANAMRHDIEKGMSAGFFHYLTKPIRVNEFTDTLNRALAFAKASSLEGSRES